MYSIIKDSKTNSAKVYYDSPCAKKILVANVLFIDGAESGVLIEFPHGKSSLASIGHIYDIVKKELDGWPKS